jgi:hypothetical protein
MLGKWTRRPSAVRITTLRLFIEVPGNTAKRQCEHDNYDQHDREQRGYVGTEQRERVGDPEGHDDIAGNPGDELLGVVGDALHAAQETVEHPPGDLRQQPSTDQDEDGEQDVQAGDLGICGRTPRSALRPARWLRCLASALRSTDVPFGTLGFTVRL